ncbi:cytochrome P450 [Altericista sp. CCNU0014]|uniref:cytochrome P450 n=1 Tax=Altericista sp. CCNU0014 TaxID=3082949 RepID=UPI00384F5D5D
MSEPSKGFLDRLKEAAENAPDANAAAQAQMQLIGEWIAISPVEFFQELRERAPIYKAPAFTLVARYEDVRDVLTLNDIFTTDLLEQNMLRFIGNTVVELPPSPEYERRKSILRLAFPMQDLGHYRNILLEESAALLDNLQPEVPFDVVGYAKTLPAKAISRYLGLGELPVDKVVQWMHDINEGAVRNLGNIPQINEAAAAASAEVKPLIANILEAVRWGFTNATTSPSTPTVLERYLLMQAVDATYTADEDIVSSLLFMMSACVDLTATAIANVVVELLQRPEELEKAIAAAQNEADDKIAAYVWEALRFRQPSPGVINTCVRDYTLGRGTSYEQMIEAGTLVLGCSISAMHDPSVIEAPTEFRIGRPWHLAYTFFEAGLHSCHGQYFSMTQIPLAVKQLLRAGRPASIDPLPVNQGYPTQPFSIKFTSHS